MTTSLGLRQPPDTTPLAQVYGEMRSLADEVTELMLDYVQAGRVTPTVSGGTSSVPVSFPRPFSTPPRSVVLTMEGSDPNLLWATVLADSITTFGFTARVHRSPGGSGRHPFNWVAVR